MVWLMWLEKIWLGDWAWGVVVCGSYATQMAVMCGIAHGPVLAPILSSFFTTDVDEVMEGLLIRLWVTLSRGEQSICSRAGLPVTQTEAGWRNGQMEIARTSARNNVMSCPGMKSPSQQDRLGPDCCRMALETLMGSRGTQVRNAPWQPSQHSGVWGEAGGAVLLHQGIHTGQNPKLSRCRTYIWKNIFTMRVKQWKQGCQKGHAASLLGAFWDGTKPWVMQSNLTADPALNRSLD